MRVIKKNIIILHLLVDSTNKICTGADDQFELRKLATYKNYL